MIKLEVEEYCQDCPEFEPDVEKEDLTEILYSDDPFSGRSYITVGEHKTTIRCIWRRRCECLKNHIDQESKKEKKNG